MSFHIKAKMSPPHPPPLIQSQSGLLRRLHPLIIISLIFIIYSNIIIIISDFNHDHDHDDHYQLPANDGAYWAPTLVDGSKMYYSISAFENDDAQVNYHHHHHHHH